MFFFFKQKTAYEMRISDWSSDVCSSDLIIIKIPLVLGDDGAAHDEQCVDREMRVEPESGQAVPVDEAPHLEIFIGELGGDVGLLQHRRLVAGRLEDAAEQAGGDDPVEPGPVEPPGQHLGRLINTDGEWGRKGGGR